MTISFEHDVTVLVGENGCGKSSVLNALEACLGRDVTPGDFNVTIGDFHRETYNDPPATFMKLILSFSEHPEDEKVSVPLVRAAGLVNPQGSIDFKAVFEAHLENATTAVKRFRFEKFDGSEVKAEDPAALLTEIRSRVPFMRIRSQALQPPIQEKIAADGKALTAPIEKIENTVRQAYSEILSDSDYAAQLYMEEHSEALSDVLESLHQHLSNTDTSGIEERLSAPLSTSGDWSRYASMLRSSAARSLAMLAFTGSFLEARGTMPFPEGSSPIIAVEDPEALMHPLMLTFVWNLIERLPSQKIVTTNSSDLLSAIPLTSMRRMTRSNRGYGKVFQVHHGEIPVNDLRRIAYHLRIRRGTALFMRFWLLVEGETEYWLLPEVARAMNYNLWAEGVEFVEFAQCGLAPLAMLANQLGIHWHLVADGDKAGEHYTDVARPLAKAAGLGRVTKLNEVDIEHTFWENGYEHVFRNVAGQQPNPRRADKSNDIIKRAIKSLSKPGLALNLGMAISEQGSAGVPSQIESIIIDAVSTARSGHRPGEKGDIEALTNRKNGIKK